MSNRQSAATRVGAPTFGGPQSQRGRMIANVTGDPAPEPVAPSAVPTSEISFNPDNPRDEIGDVSDLVDSFNEVGQIVAITVSTIEAYLASRPHGRNDLEPQAKYVVVDGNRRLEAARQAGLATIKIMLGDEFVTTDETLLEAAFLANAKRKDFSELEEAQALKSLVDFYGSQHKAAKRLGMSQPLISQKMSLLALTPELQADLEAGRRQVSHVRGMAKLDPDEQHAEADRRAEADAEKKRQRAASVPKAPSPQGDNSVIGRSAESSPARGTGASDNSVITEPAVDQQSGPVKGDNSVITPETSAPAPTGTVGGPVRHQQSADLPTSRLPWGNPKALDRILREHMTNEDRLTLAKLLGE